MADEAVTVMKKMSGNLDDNIRVRMHFLHTMKKVYRPRLNQSGTKSW